MFWIFILFVGQAALFVRLGVMSVWIVVLKLALQALLLMLGLAALIFTGRRLLNGKYHQGHRPAYRLHLHDRLARKANHG